MIGAVIAVSVICYFDTFLLLLGKLFVDNEYQHLHYDYDLKKFSYSLPNVISNLVESF